MRPRVKWGRYKATLAFSLLFIGCSAVEKIPNPQDYNSASVVARIFSDEQTFDYAVLPQEINAHFLGAYPGGLGDKQAPSLKEQFDGASSRWFEWESRHKDEAQQLTKFRSKGIYYHKIAFSDDRKFSALSVGETNGTEVWVIDRARREVFQKRKLSGSRRVDDLVWERDSGALLVLEKGERLSLSPFGLLTLLAGHPIPINSFHIARLNIQSDEFQETERAFLQNVTYGGGYLLLRQRLTKRPTQENLWIFK